MLQTEEAENAKCPEKEVCCQENNIKPSTTLPQCSEFENYSCVSQEKCKTNNLTIRFDIDML